MSTASLHLPATSLQRLGGIDIVVSSSPPLMPTSTRTTLSRQSLRRPSLLAGSGLSSKSRVDVGRAVVSVPRRLILPTGGIGPVLLEPLMRFSSIGCVFAWHHDRSCSLFFIQDKPISLLKRIANIRKPSRQAKLSPAELLIQMALRKRASAFVDARDDLETKIGRLSRRLNFLLTESDLWR